MYGSAIRMHDNPEYHYWEHLRTIIHNQLNLMCDSINQQKLEMFPRDATAPGFVVQGTTGSLTSTNHKKSGKKEFRHIHLHIWRDISAGMAGYGKGTLLTVDLIPSPGQQYLPSGHEYQHAELHCGAIRGHSIWICSFPGAEKPRSAHHGADPQIAGAGNKLRLHIYLANDPVM